MQKKLDFSKQCKKLKCTIFWSFLKKCKKEVKKLDSFGKVRKPWLGSSFFWFVDSLQNFALFGRNKNIGWGAIFFGFLIRCNFLLLYQMCRKIAWMYQSWRKSSFFKVANNRFNIEFDLEATDENGAKPLELVKK